MDRIEWLLGAARSVIDGECDCHTPEYVALDLLHQAVRELLRSLERLQSAAQIKTGSFGEGSS